MELCVSRKYKQMPFLICPGHCNIRHFFGQIVEEMINARANFVGTTLSNRLDVA